MAQLMDKPLMRVQKRGVGRMKKHDVKTDMTPMVDLGFLLIAFFIVTTELSEPRRAELAMPKDGPPMKLEMSNALTVMIDNNSIYYYEGDWERAKNNRTIYKTGVTGSKTIREVIIDKQIRLDQVNPTGERRDGLMLLLKPGERSDYQDIIKIFDEVLINGIKKYALVRLIPDEINYLNSQVR